jgi:tetratricopeptide (TPR) repeat protein
MERLKRWHGLARLKRQVRNAPSPAAVAELAERLIALGETDLALREAERGLEVFPDSERLLHIRTFAKKGRLSAQIRRLKEDLHRRPNALTYVQLAKIYRELGSQEEALSIAAECSERFPLNEAGYLVQGEIRAERFRRDLIAKDGIVAEAALSRVVRLNAANVTAHLLLAEIYWLVGMAAECRAHLAQVLETMPAAHEVQEFLRATEGVSGPAEEAFEDLASKAERDGVPANDPALFPSHANRTGAAKAQGPLDAEAVRGAIASLGEHDGMMNAVLCDREGNVVADFAGASGLPRGQFAELVSGIRGAADDASRRMDTGALVRAEIEGPGGNVTVSRVRGLTVAVLYKAPLRADRVWEVLQDFVAHHLASTREEAHA